MSKYGIIGAMDVEIEGIKNAMSDVTAKSFGGSEFYFGSIGGNAVVVAQSGIGKVNAAFVATVMLSRFGVESVVMTGIAGGIGGGLSGLDAFVPSAFVQHDVVTLGCEDGFIDVIGKVVLEPDAELSERLAQASGAKRGLMATGEQFVQSEAQVTAILAKYPAAIAVDMESAAVAQVCLRMHTPFACLKVISDNGKATDTYYDFKSLAANKAISAVISLLHK